MPKENYLCINQVNSIDKFLLERFFDCQLELLNLAQLEAISFYFKNLIEKEIQDLINQQIAIQLLIESKNYYKLLLENEH